MFIPFITGQIRKRNKEMSFSIMIIRPMTLRRGDEGKIFEILTHKNFITLAILKKKICDTTLKALYPSLEKEEYEKASKYYKGDSLLLCLTHLVYSPISLLKEIVGPSCLLEASSSTLRGMIGRIKYGGVKGNPYDDVCHYSESEDRADYELNLLFPLSVVNFVKNYKNIKG